MRFSLGGTTRAGRVASMAAELFAAYLRGRLTTEEHHAMKRVADIMSANRSALRVRTFLHYSNRNRGEARFSILEPT